VYRPSGDPELSQAQMERVRSVYIGRLWRHRFKPEFIHNHAEDLIAEAHSVYVEAIRAGEKIDDPVGWTVVCAWCRTQNHFKSGKTRYEVTTEKLPEPVNTGPETAEFVEALDRAQRLREAIEDLRRDEQQMVALAHFEGLSIRKAAERLDLPFQTARRRYLSAMEKLEEHFKAMGIESSDDLLIEAGAIAYMVVTSQGLALHLPQVVEIAADKSGEAASSAWARAHDLARRISIGGGSDAASAAATSGGGRTLGVCAGLAITCVLGAGAVVGTGVGHHGTHHRSNSDGSVAMRQAESAPTSESAQAEAAPSAATETTASVNASPPASKSSSSAGGTASSQKQAAHRANEQFDAASRIASESGSPASQPVSTTPVASSTQSASASTTSSAETSTATTSSGGGSPRARAQAAQQFGTIR
jgi:RNA polymerase sigma factor (sigma-70 family)